MTAPTKAQIIDIKDAAKDNEDFRRVVFTAGKSQLVLMSVPEGESIGLEAHGVDQLLYVVSGEGTAKIDGVDTPFEKGAIICVPAGAMHDIVNTGDKALKLFTIYAPPEHAPGTVYRTKADAEAADKQELVTA